MEARQAEARQLLKTVSLKMMLVDVSEKRMSLRLGQYGFLAFRNKKFVEVRVGRRGGSGVEEVVKIIIRERDLANQGIQTLLAEKLAESGDEFLAANSSQVAEALVTYLKSWRDLLKRRELEKLLAIPVEDDYRTVDAEALKSVEFDKVLTVVSSIFSPSISKLLEIVMSAGLTLKQVDREKGVVDNRPVWLSIVADPSTYKTSTLKLLSESRNVVFTQNFTPASILPAKEDVEPLITKMHDKVFIIPTLSEETADKEMAKKVFAALESVYDGEYSKSTGLSGFKKEIVDTVVIAAVTPAVWEWVLPYIVNIGSRWLVYRYVLREDEALRVQQNLESVSRDVGVLRSSISKYFDAILENITYLDLKNVQIPDQYRKDLEDLAKLTARLRAVWTVKTYWELDEKSGKSRPLKEVEVVQVESPSRAYQQLVNFVRANTLLRKSSVNKIVGLPIVDEHAMRLAAEISISSTTNQLKDIIVFLVEKQLIGDSVSYATISSATGQSIGTVNNLLKVLRHPRVDLIEEDWSVKEPFYSLICKYLLKPEGESVA
ncbi:MAG: hypothetical protein QW148_05050 [Thermosphaera sp.]